MLDELYETADVGFLKYLTRFEDYEFLLHFTNRWTSDSRPWARKQLIKFIDGVWDSPGHEVVIKRVFKHAENVGDQELLIHFLVALDRVVRRSRVQSWSYNWRTRQSTTSERLFAKPNRTVREQTNRSATHTYGRRTYTIRLPDLINRPGNRLFSQKTRAHLRRRVWRWFRQLSYRDPQAYVPATCAAMKLYRDRDFASGEAILDNWALMHAGYFGSDVLSFTAAHCNLATGKSLSDLRAAPYQTDAWNSSESAIELWRLLSDARSVLVRRWTIEMLESLHKSFCESIALDELLNLLAHNDASIQAFAVERFNQHPDLEKIGIDAWLKLVNQADVSVLATVCDALRKNVNADRLTADQMLKLACAQRFPAAQLGFEFLKQRHLETPLSADDFAALADVSCDQIAGELCDWSLSELTILANKKGSVGHSNHVIRFFDSLSAPVRQSACRWLLASGSPGANDAELWAKLSESPNDDVRFALVELLRPIADGYLSTRPQTRSSRSTLSKSSDSAGDLARVWSAVILCVNRGNRTKPKAIRQLAASIGQRPDLVGMFLPTLAVAARSIRPPERQAALSSLAWIGNQNEALRQTVSEMIPELEWVS